MLTIAARHVLTLMLQCIKLFIWELKYIEGYAI